jgi:rod shape-determining protein MreB and related proteins
VSTTDGVLVVNLGAGSTDVAAIAQGEMLILETVPVGGDALDAAIERAVSAARGMPLAAGESERLKRELGSAVRPVGDRSAQATAIGSNREPVAIEVSTAEVHSAIEHLVDEIGSTVDRVLGQVPPERRTAVRRNGLILTGGGAQLRGLPEYLGSRTGTGARVAREPEACVAMGTGMALDNLQVIRRGQHYIT